MQRAEKMLRVRHMRTVRSPSTVDHHILKLPFPSFFDSLSLSCSSFPTSCLLAHDSSSHPGAGDSERGSPRSPAGGVKKVQKAESHVNQKKKALRVTRVSTLVFRSIACFPRVLPPSVSPLPSHMYHALLIAYSGDRVLDHSFPFSHPFMKTRDGT